ncbi:capsular polysaccharide export protein, LipB/KpsS family [Halomonas piscis]|uniref:capsular polysaccharide export protein, LipB/KpsS family n=1 Tax=Halomonas piscis TaxID=3031727 RepID=UPI0038992A3F
MQRRNRRDPAGNRAATINPPELAAAVLPPVSPSVNPKVLNLASDTRTFLFLQGVCSPFNARLASRLEHEGHRVIKLHFNAGDIVYWGRQGHHRHLFRGRLEALGDYVQTLWQRYGVTDQIVFGDRRPIHRTAVENAPRAGIRTHVFEEGYFRPYLGHARARRRQRPLAAPPGPGVVPRRRLGAAPTASADALYLTL